MLPFAKVIPFGKLNYSNPYFYPNLDAKTCHQTKHRAATGGYNTRHDVTSGLIFKFLPEISCERRGYGDYDARC